ncbi:MAG: tyrosine-type recombinase/integrase, partial [Planctomycetes bacterium]|nr:tyrosine-type recombinase/integrase [Planctomycetota bacterium]
MRVFKKTTKSAKFTIEMTDHLGIARRFPGLTDRRQSEQLGRRIEALIGCRSVCLNPDRELTGWLERAPQKLKVRLATLDIIDKERLSASKPLQDLIDGFEKHMQAQERSPQHVRETVNMVTAVFNACDFKSWTNIASSKVKSCLMNWRRAGVPISLLKVKGKAKERKPIPISFRRSNAYLVAAKSFCQHVVDEHLATENPLRGLKKLEEEKDRRRERRAPTAEEFARLIATTVGGPVRYGMRGWERALLYRWAHLTGLRPVTIRRMLVAHVNPDERNYKVLGQDVKNGKAIHQQVLKSSLVEDIRALISGKHPGAKLFGGTYKQLTKKTSGMIQDDLADAGIPYETQDGYFDFYAARHGFCTNVDAASTSDGVTQDLMGHQSP